MAIQINEPTTEIAASIERWKRNRVFISGEDAVKKAGSTYVIQLPCHTAPGEFAKYIRRLPFFPGAARTHESLLGLVTRKQGVFTYPDALAGFFNTITRAGHSVEDLAKDVFSETLATAFTGLLIDVPAASSAMMTEAKIAAENIRPFVSMYQAESILEVRTGVYANRQKIDRVRLLEDEATVRELLLIEGVYHVIVHRSVGGQWIADPAFTPLRKGKPQTEIPFIVVTPSIRSFAPTKGPLDDVVLTNVHLFHAETDAANSRWFSAMPQLTILGAKKPDAPLTMYPGQTWWFDEHSAETPVVLEYLEFKGLGQTALDAAVSTKKDELSKLGLNILAPEKSAVEAAETHAIRRASENSLLASLARAVSRKIEEALNIAAAWDTGADQDIHFELNTDFVPQAMSAAERKVALEEFMSGAISRETYWSMLQTGEILPDSFDPEVEAERLIADSATIDRPTTEAIPTE